MLIYPGEWCADNPKHTLHSAKKNKQNSYQTHNTHIDCLSNPCGIQEGSLGAWNNKSSMHIIKSLLQSEVYVHRGCKRRLKADGIYVFGATLARCYSFGAEDKYSDSYWCGRECCWTEGSAASYKNLCLRMVTASLKGPAYECGLAPHHPPRVEASSVLQRARKRTVRPERVVR